MMKKLLPKIIVIVGPTASGKSDLAVFLAERFNGEVISADSRQVYTGLDIGSGKITKKEMMGVAHHMLDVADPKDIYNAEKFKKDSAMIIKDILERGRVPIICGGTGFYIDALVFGETFPPVPPQKQLRAKLEKQSPESLMKMIARLDPKRALAIDPHNKVRIIRAIEIAKALGKVPKVKRKKQYDVLWIGLTLPREKLRQKIHERLLGRLKTGMIKEVRDLHKTGVSWKRLYQFGLEYRYISLYLRNKTTKMEMLARLETEICQFAKRQMTWFGRNKDIRWFSPKDGPKIKKEIQKFIK